MKYYYGLQRAFEAGVGIHPQRDILRLAPDAHDFRPESLGDCWFFDAAEIADPPVYILPCGADGIPLWNFHTPNVPATIEGDVRSWSDIVIKVPAEGFDIGGES